MVDCESEIERETLRIQSRALVLSTSCMESNWTINFARFGRLDAEKDKKSHPGQRRTNRLLNLLLFLKGDNTFVHRFWGVFFVIAIFFKFNKHFE